MGWLLFLAMALIIFAALWRLAKLDAAALQFLGAALLLALAGYAWQGQPGLEGRPKPPPERRQLADSAFSETRRDMLGSFDQAARWLGMAESYQRSGDTRGGADMIRSGLRQHPRDPDLWVGLGSALVLHADGMMTPAAELAFRRAEQIAPGHPGPRFFYGLALAQSGRYDEAERLWRALLATTSDDVSWRPMVEERLAMIEQARAAGQLPPAPTPPQP
ncbi:MAG TPA: tetratricopeptide repeat protein [Allosphingosinicella sp.]|nr:tetratricopeptide repeat protein [Allosphingosinicella sp.]